MRGVKTLLTTFTLLLVVVSPALATDTTKTYNSGILVLLFVGFCALLIIAQLVPAVLALFGMTKEGAKGASGSKLAASAKKH
ncbi:hypothetical protein SAMN05660420_00124 [Desulfuromusa kysingii]|uniref:Uncharacterized protein n=1 Tax=Desulfuromusa kysingii TaxID=37625 RepID=A0A1H3VKB0_9BACT|nr:hypothetical protein [Desulfuromusa kysingii]SDZ75216.1 hypothetical protein SAMN05660420_00124 [Desulfuromusa kysingii]